MVERLSLLLVQPGFELGDECGGAVRVQVFGDSVERGLHGGFLVRGGLGGSSARENKNSIPHRGKGRQNPSRRREEIGRIVWNEEHYKRVNIGHLSWHALFDGRESRNILDYSLIRTPLLQTRPLVVAWIGCPILEFAPIVS